MQLIDDKLRSNNNWKFQPEVNMPTNLICFSHLRWDFVYQRPQHLLTRYATLFNVYFVEEPVFDAQLEPKLTFTLKENNLWVVVPHLPEGTSHEDCIRLQKNMLDKFLKGKDESDLIFWYYTPMALKFSSHHNPAIVIYDCMDELSNFKNAPAELKHLEDVLLKKSDLVFTGGHSLYHAKKHLHHNIFPFPSSIDKKHFEQARKNKVQPEDQANITGLKLGFYGVIDERFDIELVREIADKKPEWQFIFLGPIVKIDPATLPQSSNVHYLGGKSYDELPAYLSGWDIALIPFLLNDATQFISPTKTPEYLAAGIPVISTPITDVINPYGDNGSVEIAADATGFITAAERLLQMEKKEWLSKVDEFLTKQSWSLTFKAMVHEINAVIKNKSHLKQSLTSFKKTVQTDIFKLPADEQRIFKAST